MVPHDDAATWTVMESRGRGTGSRTSADIAVDPEAEIRSPVTGTVIRAGTYPGQDEDIRAVGGPNLLVASPHLPVETLLALDRAVRDGIEQPATGLRAGDHHPVLQALNLDQWEEAAVGARCTDAAAVGGRPPSGETVSEP